VESVAVVGGSDGAGVTDWRGFGQPSVGMGGWKTTRVVVV